MEMDESSLTGWLATARAIHFAGCLLIAGVWVFDRWVVRCDVSAWRRLALTILLIATPVALLSGAAWFILVASSMSDLPVGATLQSHEMLKTVWSQTRFGRVWQLHTAISFAGAVMLAVWTRFQRGEWLGLILGIGLVGGLAWAGHGSTGPAPGLHLLCDLLHLLAASVWPTGLVPLAMLLIPMARSADADRWKTIYRLVRRFSTSSLMAVGLLTLTGLFNSWCLLGSIRALITTTYGRVLIVKIVLFAVMVGIGAVNLFVLKPRLIIGGVFLRRLRINVFVEIVLGTGVVAAVGLLGLLEPPGPMN